MMGAGRSVPTVLPPANPTTIYPLACTRLLGPREDSPGIEDANEDPSLVLEAYDSGDPVFQTRTLLLFNIQDFAGWTFGAASKLRIFSLAPGGAVGIGSINIKRATRLWTENLVTWNKYDGVHAWTSAGGDFTTPTVAFTLNGSETDFYDITGAGIAAFLQDALDSRSGILNILMKVETEAAGDTGISMNSRHASSAARRPALTLVNEPPG